MSGLEKMFPSGSWCIEESVGYLLARARARLAKAIDAELAPFDITVSQGGVVLMLSTGRYATAADLVRDMYVDSASMTRMLDRLEKRGLIQRLPSTTDRRVINLQLTEDGVELAERLPALYSNVMDRYLHDFSKDEVGTLKILLRKLLDAEVPGEVARKGMQSSDKEGA